MSTTSGRELKIPERMQSRLLQFQKRLWKIKLIEGVCAGLFGLLVSYLLVFILDRFLETPSALRLGILLLGSIGFAIGFPWICHRWIWKSRSMAQVAKMLRINRPELGDYLLGVIELAHGDGKDGRSESLTRAALAQADDQTAEADFSDAVPHPKHRQWIWWASVPAALVAVVLLAAPLAGVNAFQRWLMPWKQIDRYTFTQIESLPDKIIVPLAEKTKIDTRLKTGTRWQPDSAVAMLNGQPLTAKKEIHQSTGQGAYEFSLPPLSENTQVDLRIGDVRRAIDIEPRRRPEISDLSATIKLPEYLQRDEPIERDIRGGALSTVAGSVVAVKATTTRELTSASVDGQPAAVDGRCIKTSPVVMSESKVMELNWLDAFELSSKSPLKLNLRSTADEAPSLVCRNLERQRVMMEKELLSLEVDAFDDFGLKTLGIQWSGNPSDSSLAAPAAGEKIFYAGNPEATEVNSATVTFSPKRESISPQVIRLRLFAEDYLPDRERVYSPDYTIYVLSEDDHAIWITGRLDKWFKQSLETYELERQLFKQNVELRSLSAAELDNPEARRKLQAQAAAENAQAARLTALTREGESLVQEATKNDNFGVDHMEQLAETIQTLKDIQQNQMPNVADLLAQAANAAGSTPSDSAPSDSSEQSPSQPGQPGEPASSGGPGSQPPPASVADNPESPGKKSSSSQPGAPPSDETPPPTIALKESNHNTGQEAEEESEPGAPPSSPSSPPPLSLPSVALDALPEEPDDSDDGGGVNDASEVADRIAEAVDSQEELLAEFQKIAEELSQLLGNLEGSTFVKRLKAMSRRELEIAQAVDEASLMGFGEDASKLREATLARTKLLAERQETFAKIVQDIEDDLAAFINRKPDGKYKNVLAEMRDTEAVSDVQLVAQRMLDNEPGTSIADAELLADTFDRWAEQLVGPG